MDRRHFLKFIAAALLVSPHAHAMGEEDLFTVGLLEYSGNFNPRPTALRRLLLETEKVTNIRVKANELILKASAKELWNTPLIFWAGDRKFDPLPEDHISTIRRYLQAGGMLVIDSSDGLEDGPFTQSVKRELSRIFPDRKVLRIPKDHVIYKSFYLIEEPLGRLTIAPHMLGVWDDERISVVLSSNDMFGAWARDTFGNWLYECSPGRERQRELSFRLGVNLLMYSLCINYKADQVHIPFILGRRKWKVD